MSHPRPTSRNSIFRRLRTRVRDRLERAAARPAPIRAQRLITPQVRSLEPRFVLNATAEFNVMLGQLSVTGTDASEAVQMTVETDGNLALRDGAGQVIPIELSDGSGSVDRLDPDVVNLAEFDMGAGNDLLDLQLPGDFDLTVFAGDGRDDTVLRFLNEPPNRMFGGQVGENSDVIMVTSNSIRLNPGSPFVSLSGNTVELTGDLFLGIQGQRSVLELEEGSLEVDGRVIVAGDAAIVGQGSVDFSDATITANAPVAATPSADLRFNLGQGPDSQLRLGGADDSGGSLIRDVAVDSANSLSVESDSFTIAGDLIVRAVAEETRFASLIDAGSLSSVTAGDVDVEETIRTRDGDLRLSTPGSLTIAGDLDTSVDKQISTINLSGQSVQISDATFTTSGGLVNVVGPVEISGDVKIDSGKEAGTAGRVQFFGPIQSDDAMGDTLVIEALGSPPNGMNVVDGAVRLQGPVGNTPTSPGAMDLNLLAIKAGQIEVNSIGVVDGNVDLTANFIRLFGTDIRTSDSGDINITGDFLLPVRDTNITSAGSAKFNSPVRGQPGTLDFNVNAVADAVFEQEVMGIRDFDVSAGELARFSGEVTLSRDMDVRANEVLILAPINAGDDVRLRANQDVNVQAAITTDGGDVEIVADRDVRFTAVGDVSSRGGNVFVSADAEMMQPGGTIVMADGTLINADSGVITLIADQNITIGGLLSTRQTDIDDTTDNAIQLTSKSAAILDAGDQHLDLVANSGRVDISTVTGIGPQQNQGALETQIDRLRSTVSGTGVTHILEQDRIVLESVMTQNGSITIASGQMTPQIDQPVDGTIEALEVVSKNPNDQDIQLTAEGQASDIIVTSIVAAAVRNENPSDPNEESFFGSDVVLTAGNDVINADKDVTPLVADDLIITAQNKTGGDRDASISLQTEVFDFEASVLGTNRGDIVINETDEINLASSDKESAELVQTGNGQIVVEAGTKITVVDNDLTETPEIIANGDLFGRIDLRASTDVPDQEIELLENVQLQAFKIQNPFANPVTETPANAAPETSVIEIFPKDREETLSEQDRSVFLKSDRIIFDEIVEINTGPNQGVARIFSPRPLVLQTMQDPITGDPVPVPPERDDTDSAFFIATSVGVNVLEQALVNDAIGRLEVNIGQTGERGLTINLDWGAPNRPIDADDEFNPEIFPQRFQQISGLSADDRIFVGVDESGKPVQPVVQTGGSEVLVIEHYYTQANIVDSRVNLRDSSTDTLNVRFEVRHHESIRIEADSVRQGEGEQENVAGSVISSTDNPDTDQFGPPLEPGDRDPTTDTGLENGRATFLIPSLTIPRQFVPERDVIPEFEARDIVSRDETTTTLTQTTIEVVDAVVTEDAVSREEYLQIRVLSPDPDGEDLADPERLPDNIFAGDTLQDFFKELEDGRYEIEYVLGDANKRSILSVDVRDGEATITEEELEEGILRLERIRQELLDQRQEDAGNENRGLTLHHSPDSLPDVEAIPLTQSENEQNAGKGEDFIKSSLPPAMIGVALASMRRRRSTRGKRLSIAGRFARRRSVVEGDVLNQGIK